MAQEIVSPTVSLYTKVDWQQEIYKIVKICVKENTKMLLMLPMTLMLNHLQSFQVSKTHKCFWFNGNDWIHAQISEDTHTFLYCRWKALAMMTGQMTPCFAIFQYHIDIMGNLRLHVITFITKTMIVFEKQSKFWVQISALPRSTAPDYWLKTIKSCLAFATGQNDRRRSAKV